MALYLNELQFVALILISIILTQVCLLILLKLLAAALRLFFGIRIYYEYWFHRADFLQYLLDKKKQASKGVPVSKAVL